MKKEKLSITKWIIKIVINIVGLFLLALGVVTGILCGLGASPFDVLQLGMSNLLPITVGQASQIVAILFLIYTWSRGVIPGLGTILNAIFVGGFIDLIFTFGIQTPDTLVMKVAMLVASILLAGFGIVISLKAKIGVGTRDAFMEYVVTKTNKSVGKIRATIEIIAFISGALLGGDYGVGTIIVAVTLGHVITFAAKLLNYDFDISNHYTFKDSINLYKSKIEECSE